MHATEDGYVGAEECTGADGDKTCIYDCAIEVDEYICTKSNVGPVVHTYGSLDPGFVIKLCSILLSIG